MSNLIFICTTRFPIPISISLAKKVIGRHTVTLIFLLLQLLTPLLIVYASRESLSKRNGRDIYLNKNKKSAPRASARKTNTFQLVKDVNTHGYGYYN